MRTSATLIGLTCILIGAHGDVALAAPPTNPVTFAYPAARAAAAQSLESVVSARGVDTLQKEIETAKITTGDIDQAVYSVLGMSARDIRKHGLLGEPGSQLRQLFGKLGLPH